MQIKLVNNSGNGSIDGPSLVSYSYSEDVTSLEPSTLSGGTSQVTASAINVNGDKVGDTHPDSKLLINNSMSLVHNISGQVDFTVKQVNKNLEVVSIVGDTLQSNLNIEVTALPHGGSGYTVYSALQYYCGLAGITQALGNLVFEDDLEVDLDNIPANFMGWNGNLWEHLKMFCAAVSASETDNVGIEAYMNENVLTFRKAKTTLAEFAQKDLSNQSISIDSFNAAQKFEIFNYNTEYKNDSVVQSVSINKENLPSVAQNATIGDAIQVGMGETVVRRYTINASLDNVNQPTVVNSILPLPYVGASGQYVVAGNDGILLQATQWTAQGGKLVVKLTENPNEIEITITAPAQDSIAQAVGAEVGYAPYKVGIEIADGQEYPALFITGDGVFYNKVSNQIYTGADVASGVEVSAPTVDNIFITNTKALYTRGMAAAQVICGPKISLSESVSTIEEFGATPGKLRAVESNKYRLNSVSYAAEGTEVSGTSSATFSDFNAIWSGLTFADFTNTALDKNDFPEEALKFNEFTVIPLMSAEPVA